MSTATHRQIRTICQSANSTPSVDSVNTNQSSSKLWFSMCSSYFCIRKWEDLIVFLDSVVTSGDISTIWSCRLGELLWKQPNMSEQPLLFGIRTIIFLHWMERDTNNAMYQGALTSEGAPIKSPLVIWHGASIPKFSWEGNNLFLFGKGLFWYVYACPCWSIYLSIWIVWDCGDNSKGEDEVIVREFDNNARSCALMAVSCTF